MAEAGDVRQLLMAGGGADVAVVIDLGGGEGSDIGAGDGEAELVVAVEAVAQLATGEPVLRGEEANDGPVEAGVHAIWLMPTSRRRRGAGIWPRRSTCGSASWAVARVQDAGRAVADVAPYSVALHGVHNVAGALDKREDGGLAFHGGPSAAMTASAPWTALSTAAASSSSPTTTETSLPHALGTLVGLRT
jgi:hypothetical protein